MKQAINIKRTNSNNKDFQHLIRQLDTELWTIMNEIQSVYDQYNKVPGIETAVVAYINNEPVASGCFKKINATTVEIKRMFVVPVHRGKGVANMVLGELEKWAAALGYLKLVLETGKKMLTAQALYKKNGYTFTENYGPYIGMAESVCMKKELNASEFKQLQGIEYFDFEEDFIEENVRCIPMTVRFKMDAAGIKLKLAEWSKFSIKERIELAVISASTNEEAITYNQYLSGLIKKYTGHKSTALTINTNPDWSNLEIIPAMLQEKAMEFNLIISIPQWKQLTNLQRFTLLKLCRPGHENKNFPKAILEFGLK